MPEGLRQQLDFVPINCLQSDANCHKLLLRQPRHFASLTYSSLSIFFKRTHTENSHTIPMCFLLTFVPPSCSRGEINFLQLLCGHFRMGSCWLSLVFSEEERNEEGNWNWLSLRPESTDSEWNWSMSKKPEWVFFLPKNPKVNFVEGKT